MSQKAPIEAIIIGVYSANESQPASLALSNNTSLVASSGLSSALVATVSDGVATGRWGVSGKFKETRIVHDLGKGPASLIALVGLGKKSAERELDFEAKECVRLAVSAAARALRDYDITKIYVGDMNFAHGAAEGAHLGLYTYSKHGDARKSKKPNIAIAPLSDSSASTVPFFSFSTGTQYAAAQNLSRFLTELPANLATPMILADKVRAEFEGHKNVTVNIHDELWMEGKNMGSLLSVSRGSKEEARFVEIIYNGKGSGAFPLALVGKGVTFDSGGISLKPGKDMHLMKGDMGGAATVIAAISGASKLGLAVDVVGIIGFVENMPSHEATKPGDVVFAANGMSIEVINTDAEGRLVLADALHYACTTYNPTTVIDFATLTGAVMIALGPPFAGVWSTTDDLWSSLDVAGKETGDPFWRMPFHEHYRKQVCKSNVADLVNSTATRYGGACNAAAFLSHFVRGVLPREGEEQECLTAPAYAHIDIAAVAEEGNNQGYQPEGMTGRPTRTVIEYLRRLAK